MNESYFDKINNVFIKLPYQFNVTEIVFEMYNNIPKLDSSGQYNVRLKNNDAKDKKYDVIEVIGPYGLNIKKFNNISIEYDEEDNNYIGKLWMPTIIFNNLDIIDKSFLLENFKTKREEFIKDKISNLTHNNFNFNR